MNPGQRFDINAINKLWLDGMSQRDIAESLGMTEVQVNGVVRRGRKRMGLAKWPYRRNYGTFPRVKVRPRMGKKPADEAPDSQNDPLLRYEIKRLHRKGLSAVRIAPLVRAKYADMQAVIEQVSGRKRAAGA